MGFGSTELRMMLLTCKGVSSKAQEATNAAAGAYWQYQQRLPGISFRSNKARSMLIKID
jgi:hypothetical protein